MATCTYKSPTTAPSPRSIQCTACSGKTGYRMLLLDAVVIEDGKMLGPAFCKDCDNDLSLQMDIDGYEAMLADFPWGSPANMMLY